MAYNPDTDISLVEDVIVVTANYRLNVFGFLASGALREQVTHVVVVNCCHDIRCAMTVSFAFVQDPDGSTGNYGLQVCGLICRNAVDTDGC